MSCGWWPGGGATARGAAAAGAGGWREYPGLWCQGQGGLKVKHYILYVLASYIM